MSRETFKKGIRKYAQEELGMDEDQSEEYADLVEFVKNCHVLELSRADMNKEASSELGSTPYGRYLKKEASERYEMDEDPPESLGYEIANLAYKHPRLGRAVTFGLAGGTAGPLVQLLRGKGLKGMAQGSLVGGLAGAGTGAALPVGEHEDELWDEMKKHMGKGKTIT